jgi:hypothetical protein
MKYELAGDCSIGNMDGGARGSAECDGSEDVADAGMRNAVTGGVKVGSDKFDLSTGHGCRRRDAVQMGSLGRGGVEETHPNSRVERLRRQYKLLEEEVEELCAQKREYAGGDVVEHNAGAFR